MITDEEERWWPLVWQTRPGKQLQHTIIDMRGTPVAVVERAENNRKRKRAGFRVWVGWTDFDERPAPPPIARPEDPLELRCLLIHIYEEIKRGNADALRARADALV